MKITLTAAQVEILVREHVQKSLPGVDVCFGYAEIFQDFDGNAEPVFGGFSFAFSPKKTKYKEIYDQISNDPVRNDKIQAIKEVRKFSQGCNVEELETFPRQLNDPWGGQVIRVAYNAGDCLGLAYAKALVEKIWAENPITIPF